LEGTVRVTVLATGFNPYSREGKQVVREAYGVPEAAQSAGVSNVAVNEPPIARNPVLGPVPNAAPSVTPQASSQDVVAAARERLFNRQIVDPVEVIDESDLDIPAFIREHRSRG
jgi:hypothetical protein